MEAKHKTKLNQAKKLILEVAKDFQGYGEEDHLKEICERIDRVMR